MHNIGTFVVDRQPEVWQDGTRSCTCLNDHYSNLEFSTLSSPGLCTLLTIEFVNAVRAKCPTLSQRNTVSNYFEFQEQMLPESGNDNKVAVCCGNARKQAANRVSWDEDGHDSRKGSLAPIRSS